MIDTPPSSVLFVSGVDLSRPHPSSYLALSYQKLGVHVSALFLDARNGRQLFRDFQTLTNRLKSHQYARVIANVNGPVAQCLILLAAKMNRVPCDFWIMDCYPGCLKYVTKLWWLFWIPFFILTFFVKKFSSTIFYIDEAFAGYSPNIRRGNFHTIRLARPDLRPATHPADESGQSQRSRAIGIVGNIEQHWIDEDFDQIYPEIAEAGYSFVVATSSDRNLQKFSKEKVNLIAPWRKEDTERVFESFEYILVPLSESRIYYSSPSKIIDAYARGIQPVIYGDASAWETNRHRLIYSHCISYDEFIRNSVRFTSTQLIAHAENWPGRYEDIALSTLDREAQRK